ncbi:MAG: glycosyltransferase, partial [Acidimicrobiia bacterium]
GEVERLNQTLDFPVIVIQAPGHWNLGDCYNVAVEAATGDFITKWDDDDYYGESHITDLVLAQRYSNADIVGKMVEFVYLEDLDITVARDTGGSERMNNRHVAGGTMMMTRHLARTLRFDRRRRWVDAGILARARNAGCTIYATHPLGYMLNRHGRGHTWESDSSQFLQAERVRVSGLQHDLAGVREGLGANSGDMTSQRSPESRSRQA